MKNRYKILFCIAASMLLLGVLVIPGCFDRSKPVPPDVDPKPTPAGTTILVLRDAADNGDLSPYSDPILDKFAADKGHDLRIHPTNVVDESKPPKPPKYLVPYLDFAKDKKLPIVMLVNDGKVKGYLERPTDVQAILAYLDKTLGEVVPESGFYGGGAWRKLGSLKPAKPGAEKRWTVEGSQPNEAIIPREKWVERDMTPYLWEINDQGSRSSCAPTSLATVNEMVAAIAGLKKFNAAPLDIYWQVNGGTDSGATLEDCARVLTTIGICTTDYCPEQGVRKPSYKVGYEVSRAKHRAYNVTFCPDNDAIGSALQRYKPVHLGLLVGSDFSPNADGIIGPKKGRGSGGHALACAGVRKINGEVYFLLINSWSTNWGGSRDGKVPKGCCWIHESWIEPMFGAFAYGAIVSPSDDPIAQGKPQTIQPQPVFANAL